MGKLFGTDGIRGVAGRWPITAEMALRVGRAVAAHFQSDGGRPQVFIGQDTRLSGDMLAHALAAGVCAQGGQARPLGVLPTPAVAHAAAAGPAAAGVMVSASHNPYADNGIKIFDAGGFKLDPDTEAALEARILAEENNAATADGPAEPGRALAEPGALVAYIDFLVSGRLHPQAALGGLRVVLDCANGATFQAAPLLFERLGIDAAVINAAPDGRNINAGCGSEHPARLAAAVRELGADAGLAFDGDGDRLVAVDETGRVLTGDVLLAIFAHHLKAAGRLSADKVVSTVMSNIGLRRSLSTAGIAHVVTAVGDRHVTAEMRRAGAVLGGEDSGHIVFGDHHSTGDGIFTGLRLLEVMAVRGRPLSQLATVIDIYPQALQNVPVSAKPPLETLPQVAAAVAAAETELGERGRVLVRYSGTQSVCRVMVEGPTDELTAALCRRIAEAVAAAIG